MRITPIAFAFLACLAIVACGEESTDEPGASSDAEEVSIPDAGDALAWGEGNTAVLLAHGASFDAASWEEQAQAIADAGNRVVALEDTSPESILTGIEYLRDEGAGAVTVIGASAGADSALDALSEEPDAADQLVTLSVNSTSDELGSEPKLFIASEDEPVASNSTELADNAPGSDNEALILPGSAHAQAIFEGDQAEPALDAILDQLESVR